MTALGAMNGERIANTVGLSEMPEGVVEYVDMPREIATVKSTGGFGFTLEDKVAASFVVQLLTGRLAFGTASSHIVALHFQTRAIDWIIDDVLVEMMDRLEK